VLELVRAALNGLGFDPAGGQGPVPEDLVFVGNRYLAWIDQTGFFGKMNGLWVLNGQPGDGLDFVVTDGELNGERRPVNMFLPGEDGEGRWPAGYKGAEHLEFANAVAEGSDPCADGWCNQYSLNEAPPITRPGIPWWTACNSGTRAWNEPALPIVDQEISGGLRLVYEGPLVKEADKDTRYDGDACHANYLFPDPDLDDGPAVATRHPVYLRVGYELFSDVDYFDRTMQFRNPAGNPEFFGAGNLGLTGGFIFTDWPSPHYLKRLNRYWRPEKHDIPLKWGDSIFLTLTGGTWTDLSNLPVLFTADVLTGRNDQALSLSATGAFAAGSSARVSHSGTDSRDVGVCLCSVHGGLEMGGGVLHSGGPNPDVSLPIAGGEMSAMATRRLELLRDAAGPQVVAHSYDAETDPALQHPIGRRDGDGWSANTVSDAPGYLSFGPYAIDWGGGSAEAVFFLMVDDDRPDGREDVVTLDIYDATARQVLATRVIRRSELRAPSTYQRFALDFDLEARIADQLEARVYWHDFYDVKLDKIIVHTAELP
jgi:hypothetical protein